jgi:hypothetical protein
VTPEAVIEGKSGEFHGGWGFYFARKYLTESLWPNRHDDPMNGYEESVSGIYIPPGRVTDKLMVYDLNRIFDDETKGRAVEIPDGVNFDAITLHKAVVGGAPGDPEDLQAYPGCILVNLGIGLYPMQSTTSDHPKWDYSVPHHHTPGIKGGIPHQVWEAEMDLETGLPKRDANGQYVVQETGGITATMIDIIRAVKSQDIFMLHLVDAIEAINLDHTGALPGEKIPEGFVFAGLDPVATDLLCARYVFSNVGIDEAIEAGLDDGHGGRFPQRVPAPAVEGEQIVTESGYDCPLARDVCFQRAEERGLGERRYHVLGHDAVTDQPLVSLQGHLGVVRQNRFFDLVTQTLYFDALKMPWDLQHTTFRYLSAVDELAGSSLKKEFLGTLDETGDGTVSYEEFGKKGLFGTLLHCSGDSLSRMGTEQLGYLSRAFVRTTTLLKCGNESWNPSGHDSMKEFHWGHTCFAAYRMSQMEVESPDLFLPDLTWGQGKWPRFQLAWFVYLGFSLYGSQFPNEIGFPSLYGLAFRYADLTQNDGRYTGSIRSQPDPNAIARYLSGVSTDAEKTLDFTFYVPEGYDNVGGAPVPNVKVTTDANRILTASFAGGQEIWQPKIGHADDAYAQSEI